MDRKSHSICRATAILALLGACTLALPACDDSKLVRRGPSNGEANNGDNSGDNNGTDDAGLGPDGDQELIEPGFMTGSWRVGNADDQALIANFDLIQEADDTAVEGAYTMGLGIYDRLEGKSGDIDATSNFSGDTLTLAWNPTDVPDEMYTITAQKQDQDTFTGRISAIDYAQLDREIIITRYRFGGAGSQVDAGM